MNSDYVAWNGERYVWPPPEGWYLASDGRWWAPDTGPDMDLGLDPVPAESAAPDYGADYQTEPSDHGDPARQDSWQAGADFTPMDMTHDPGPAPQLLPDPGPLADRVPAQNRRPEPDSTAAYRTEFIEPSSGRPVTGQVGTVPDYDATTAMVTDAADSRRNPTMVMAEAPHSTTGPHPMVAADPDTGRHDQVSVLEHADDASSTGVQRSRTMPMVAAGLLVAAAIGIAALLALLGGDNDAQTEQPSASAEEGQTGSDDLVVSTDDSGTATSADGAVDDGAMDDGAVDDDAMAGDEGAMTEDGDNPTSTTAAGGTAAATDAALIGQFRALLEENQITAAALTGDDLAIFGETACTYATSAGDLPEYEQIRDEALNGAQNDELSAVELQFVVDAAVTVFCTGDATRLGLTATPPVGG